MDNERPRIIHHCQPCNARAQFAPLYTHEWVADDGSDIEYVFAACSTCGEPALFFRQDKGADLEAITSEEAYYILYPKPETPSTITQYAPKAVTECYQEAIGARNSRLWLASAVMAERTVELVCRQFVPQCWSVFDGLEQMHKAGLLSKSLMEWGQDLRALQDTSKLGTLNKPSPWDVDAALNFIQTLFTAVYEVSHRVEQYKKTRSSQGNATEKESQRPATAETKN